MGGYVASQVVKLMVRKERKVLGAKVLMLGITFKENCPDIRNTRAIDNYNELKSYEMNVDVYDSWADAAEVKHEYGLDTVDSPKAEYDAVVLAVAHNEFLETDLRALMIDGGVIYDVKAILPKQSVDARLRLITNALSG
jgi:UDP-N-acetyl-D-galactosamine dehydrogenase